MIEAYRSGVNLNARRYNVKLIPGVAHGDERMLGNCGPPVVLKRIKKKVYARPSLSKRHAEGVHALAVAEVQGIAWSWRQHGDVKVPVHSSMPSGVQAQVGLRTGIHYVMS